MTTPNTVRFLIPAALVASAAVAFAPSTAAFAHDAILHSTPAEGETVTVLPEMWTITVAGSLLVAEGNERAFALNISDGAGLYYGDGCVEAAGNTLSTTAALGAAGDYTLTYQYVSSDGHILSGAYAFRYEPAGEETVSAGSVEMPTCPDPIDPTPNETPRASAEPTPTLTPDESTVAPPVGGFTLTGTTDGEAGVPAGIGFGALLAAVTATLTMLIVRRRRRGEED